MAISLKHAFQSAVPDDGDPNTVGSDEWNAEHQLTVGANALVGQGAAAGAAIEVPCTAFARTLLDDPDAATARGTLGLGGLATLGSVGTGQIVDDAVTYDKMQNVSATSRILSRRSAGAGSPEESTLSQVLDFIGSAARGDILFRGASAWQRLPAGAADALLQTKGSGADPVYLPFQIGSGFLRIGIVQIAWGAYSSSIEATPPTNTFAQPFADANYRITLTPTHNFTDQPRFSQVLTKAAASFTAQTFNDVSGVSGVGGSYIAIGTWSA